MRNKATIIDRFIVLFIRHFMRLPDLLYVLPWNIWGLNLLPDASVVCCTVVEVTVVEVAVVGIVVLVEMTVVTTVVVFSVVSGLV